MPVKISDHAADSKTLYVCPMHPEVQQDHPGSCPKCGMRLEERHGASRTKHARHGRCHDHIFDFDSRADDARDGAPDGG